MKRIVVLVQLLIPFFVFISCDTSKSENESVDSVEVLQTEVKIGNQVWMLKNLDVDTFRNGDSIPEAKTNKEWLIAGSEGNPVWCHYQNNLKAGKKYGKLYNWFAVVDPRGLAPIGWHVPSDEEWTILIDYLGGEEKAGVKMKSKKSWRKVSPYSTDFCSNCSSWNDEYRSKVPCHVCKDTRFVNVKVDENDILGNNESGFTGLPGGYRNYGGHYDNIGLIGYWWSSTEFSTHFACIRYLGNYYGIACRDYGSKKNGFSVRCLRD
jgi:uncharacterized protein (TIGR02145 family)